MQILLLFLIQIYLIEHQQFKFTERWISVQKESKIEFYARKLNALVPLISVECDTFCSRYRSHSYLTAPLASAAIFILLFFPIIPT